MHYFQKNKRNTTCSCIFSAKSAESQQVPKIHLIEPFKPDLYPEEGILSLLIHRSDTSRALLRWSITPWSLIDCSRLWRRTGFDIFSVAWKLFESSV